MKHKKPFWRYVATIPRIKFRHNITLFHAPLQRVVDSILSAYCLPYKLARRTPFRDGEKSSWQEELCIATGKKVFAEYHVWRGVIHVVGARGRLRKCNRGSRRGKKATWKLADVKLKVRSAHICGIHATPHRRQQAVIGEKGVANEKNRNRRKKG